MMNGHGHSYIRAAIEGEIQRLASANVGERNHTLFRATAALASLGLREGRDPSASQTGGGRYRPAWSRIVFHGQERWQSWSF